MNTGLSFQYPAWFLIFCVMLGLAYALTLYYKSQAFKEQPKSLTWLLGFLRFLSVTTLAALLLSPVLQSRITEKKKPIIILAQDQSESIKMGMKGEDTTAYKDNFNQLKSDLEADYEVIDYAFGEEIREGVNFNYTDKSSNLSSILTETYDLYSNQNLGAIVLATDGIYNVGSNPIYAGAKLNVPIFTVALGDTTIKKDVVLKRVFHNKIAYLGDKFSIQVDVTASNSAGANTRLVLSKVNGQQVTKVQEFPISITGNDFFTTQEILIEATEAGVQRYRLSVIPINGEVSRLNNTQDIFIDVLDARQKILVVANSPHPDVSAFKQVISENKNYEVDVAFASDINKNVADYNFVILHQLPSKINAITPLIKQINANKIPRLFVVGGQSSLGELNRMQSIVSINSGLAKTNEVQGFLENSFDLFTLDDKLKQELYKFPPLIAPFGDFKAAPNANVLMYQKIGTVDTKYPLLTFGEEKGIKVGVLSAEGIWKWRLFDFLQRKNYDIFDELMGKSIQYLTVKEDKRRFRVNVNKNIFNENEPIYFDAQLYNQTYELVNKEDVSLTITNSEGKKFPFTFNKTDKAYQLNAGYFPVGNYIYEGKVNVNGTQLSSKGKFSVQPIQLEVFETTADHNLLRLLSNKYEGETVYQDQLSSLVELIKAKDSVKPKLYDTMQTKNIINLKWIFFLILFLLSLEWFLRRFYGSY
ncbi:MAG: hypothetical protein ACPG19_11245 [Saprospiraceae bacterium]